MTATVDARPQPCLVWLLTGFSTHALKISRRNFLQGAPSKPEIVAPPPRLKLSQVSAKQVRDCIMVFRTASCTRNRFCSGKVLCERDSVFSRTMVRAKCWVNVHMIVFCALTSLVCWAFPFSRSCVFVVFSGIVHFPLSSILFSPRLFTL